MKQITPPSLGSLDSRFIKRDGSNAYTGTGVGFRDEDDMSSDDATAAASQQSIKAFGDTIRAMNLAYNWFTM